jgi:hypothetical protein
MRRGEHMRVLERSRAPYDVAALASPSGLWSSRGALHGDLLYGH